MSDGELAGNALALAGIVVGIAISAAVAVRAAREADEHEENMRWIARCLEDAKRHRGDSDSSQ